MPKGIIGGHKHCCNAKTDYYSSYKQCTSVVPVTLHPKDHTVVGHERRHPLPDGLGVHSAVVLQLDVLEVPVVEEVEDGAEFAADGTWAEGVLLDQADHLGTIEVLNTRPHVTN